MRLTGMWNWGGRVFAVATLLCTLAQSAAGQAGDTAVARGVEPLWPGDAIRLAFWREPALNGEYPVDERGAVILPIIGSRRVVGVPADELMVNLLEAYGRELANQEVRITLLRRVRILGAVTNPGLYHVDPTMTLADALALAGGSTRDGRLNKIRVLREGNEIKSDLTPGVMVLEQVRSGDQILVPERSWLSRNSPVVVGGLISAAAIIFARAAFSSN